MEAGQIIRFKAAINIDDRTEQRRLTGSEFRELKLARVKKDTKKTAVELQVRVARNSREDLEQIREVLTLHPGKTPVFVHVLNGAGKRATVEVGEEYWVKSGPELEAAIGRWAS